MKRLFILRHAKAGTGPDDYDRPLAPRGNRDSFWLGQYLKKTRVLPDLVLCSSAVRARETLIQLQAGAATSFPTRLQDDLYLASAHYVIRRIHRLESDITAVMIIGHNPGLSRLFQLLSHNPPRDSRSLKYPTCALAVMDFDIDDWSGLNNHSGHVLEMIIPSDRRRGQKCRKKN